MQIELAAFPELKRDSHLGLILTSEEIAVLIIVT